MTYYSEYVLFKIEQSNIHDVVLAIIEALSTVPGISQGISQV
jgi:hypothetical protein